MDMITRDLNQILEELNGTLEEDIAVIVERDEPNIHLVIAEGLFVRITPDGMDMMSTDCSKERVQWLKSLGNWEEML